MNLTLSNAGAVLWLSFSGAALIAAIAGAGVIATIAATLAVLAPIFCAVATQR